MYLLASCAICSCIFPDLSHWTNLVKNARRSHRLYTVRSAQGLIRCQQHVLQWQLKTGCTPAHRTVPIPHYDAQDFQVKSTEFSMLAANRYAPNCRSTTCYLFMYTEASRLKTYFLHVCIVIFYPLSLNMNAFLQDN